MLRLQRFTDLLQSSSGGICPLMDIGGELSNDLLSTRGLSAEYDYCLGGFMTTTDRRIQRTRDLLQKALIELVGERSYNTITISGNCGSCRSRSCHLLRPLQQ